MLVVSVKRVVNVKRTCYWFNRSFSMQRSQASGIINIIAPSQVQSLADWLPTE